MYKINGTKSQTVDSCLKKEKGPMFQLLNNCCKTWAPANNGFSIGGRAAETLWFDLKGTCSFERTLKQLWIALWLRSQEDWFKLLFFNSFQIYETLIYKWKWIDFGKITQYKMGTWVSVGHRRSSVWHTKSCVFNLRLNFTSMADLLLDTFRHFF